MGHMIGVWAKQQTVKNKKKLFYDAVKNNTYGKVYLFYAIQITNIKY